VQESSLRPVFMSHYMPWYQTPEKSGYWGWHWTMNHFDPQQTDTNGRREIASHFYPLTGPYDSQDTDILEYQVLLMKVSGIDGVLVDWYGMTDFHDYKILNESTHALFAMIQKAKLQFAIVYEDQTVLHMVNEGRLNAADAVPYGQEVMTYLQQNWFGSSAYLKLENRSILLAFGPQYFMSSSDWNSIFSVLAEKPLFFTLDNRLAGVAAGAYPWPPMWKSNASGSLTESALVLYLNQFYRDAQSWDYLVASAFPGFKDIYKEAGSGAGYGFLDAQNGKIFQLTLQKALEQNPDVIQLVTWNDYGEGTNIEPTEEYGYQYLQMVQETRASIDSTFAFHQADLALPMCIYQLRKAHSGDAAIHLLLDRVFQYIISEQVDSAQSLLDSLASVQEGDQHPVTFSLRQNYPNPFNPGTSIRYFLSQPSRVTISIYNVVGQFITTLVDDYKRAGEYSVDWDASDVSSGVYFYRLMVGERSATRKCVKLN
jgi:hypothetical protein